MSPGPRVRHAPGSFLGSLLGVVGFSVVAGLLVSATVVPGVAVASETADSGIDVFESLPDFVEIDEQSEVSTIYGRGEAQEAIPIAQFYSQNRQIVSLAEAGRWAPLAAIAGEDARFYDHGGVDMISVVRALSPVGAGGASSLTMQLVRQQIVEVACAIVDPTTGARQDEELCADQTADSYGRKLQEMRFAIALEQRYTKNEILAAYLNIANYGDATYGIQAAAQRYFSIDASQLSIAEAASLLATVQYPSNLNLSQPEHYAGNQARRDYVIQRMHTVGFITDAERDEALAIPVDDDFVQLSELESGCMASYYGSTGFFCDYVSRTLQLPQPDGSFLLGADQAANQRAFDLGGLQIFTSIDVTLNEQVQAVLDEYTPLDETRLELGGAVSMLEVGSGRILVMAQNKDFDNTDSADAQLETGVNFNVGGSDLGGGQGFQPGSGYKIFALAAWIEAGYSVSTSLDTSRHPRQIPSCGSRLPADPQNNEGRSFPRSDVVGIMENSLNTGIMEMGTRLDVCDVFEVAERMGAGPAQGGTYADYPRDQVPPALIGGAGNVTPMGMAEAFQTIASGGVHCEPTAIDRIVARDGSELAMPARDCERVLTPEVASVMQYVLQEVTNANRINDPPGPAPVISKTGTSNDVVQTWVNGASSSIASSVWIGNIQGDTGLLSVGGRAMWDRRSAVFTQVMGAALDRYPGAAFAPPDESTLQGNAVALPDVAGQTPDEARATLEGAGFTVVVGATVAGAQEAGRIEYSSPGAGALVLPRTSVTLLVSDGSQSTSPDAAIPSLEGMTLADAGTAMGAAGLDAANLQVTWARADPASRCVVLDQNPDAGTAGPPTSPVSIVVGADRDGIDPGC